jgi:hypothetical protein
VTPAPVLVSELLALAALTSPEAGALLPLLYSQHAPVAAVERTALAALVTAKLASITPQVAPQFASVLTHATTALPSRMATAVLRPPAISLRRRPHARPDDERQENDERTYCPRHCTNFKPHPLFPPDVICTNGRVLQILRLKLHASTELFGKDGAGRPRIMRAERLCVLPCRLAVRCVGLPSGLPVA